MRPRRGFTLIELLVVVVIIGILASIAVSGYNRVKQKAYIAAMKSDLRLLSIQQELYYGRRFGYTAVMDSFPLQKSVGVNLTITNATVSGWAATATHAGYPGEQCGIFVGSATAGDAPPATVQGEIDCGP